jgi:hypothetical protein
MARRPTLKVARSSLGLVSWRPGWRHGAPRQSLRVWCGCTQSGKAVCSQRLKANLPCPHSQKATASLPPKGARRLQVWVPYSCHLPFQRSKHLLVLLRRPGQLTVGPDGAAPARQRFALGRRTFGSRSPREKEGHSSLSVLYYWLGPSTRLIWASHKAIKDTNNCRPKAKSPIRTS